MRVTVLATCTRCDGALALKQAAIAEGYTVTMESVNRSDDRTERSAQVGIGLPVLIREDGALSDDGVKWIGEKKKRTKVTNPLDEVVEDALHSLPK
jgi:hypothetical protein